MLGIHGVEADDRIKTAHHSEEKNKCGLVRMQQGSDSLIGLADSMDSSNKPAIKDKIKGK